MKLPANACDRILQSFLEKQFEDGVALAAASDLVRLFPSGVHPPQRYVIEFRCTGLVRRPEGEVREAERFVVHVSFPPDYLRRIEPMEVLTFLGPGNIWHPNIVPPLICIGRIVPGTSLTDLLHQIYEVISYQKFTPREDDALNKPACAWARGNLDRFPLDRRPLRWKQPVRAQR